MLGREEVTPDVSRDRGGPRGVWASCPEKQDIASSWESDRSRPVPSWPLPFAHVRCWINTNAWVLWCVGVCLPCACHAASQQGVTPAPHPLLHPAGCSFNSTLSDTLPGSPPPLPASVLGPLSTSDRPFPEFPRPLPVPVPQVRHLSGGLSPLWSSSD